VDQEEITTMRRFIHVSLAVAALAAIGIAAHAQEGRREGEYRPDRVDALVERVHQDLDRAYSVWHLSGGERGRLNHAEHQLRDFAKHWHEGRFDKDKLDDSIGAVQHVLDNNHMRGPVREDLSRDVMTLRRMREAYDRHELGGR
jgi:hypothetical protein